MTDQRYRLLRRQQGDKRRALGLDLEVSDAYTGARRPVSTLSGGETFQASLALALGLAEVVQRHEGGVKLDTVFVDEGFGSLDPTPGARRRHPHRAPTGGRLVGIISHVGRPARADRSAPRGDDHTRRQPGALRRTLDAGQAALEQRSPHATHPHTFPAATDRLTPAAGTDEGQREPFPHDRRRSDRRPHDRRLRAAIAVLAMAVLRHRPQTQRRSAPRHCVGGASGSQPPSIAVAETDSRSAGGRRRSPSTSKAPTAAATA